MVVSIVMGVPPVIIQFRLGFSLTNTIQLWGYPHDYGNPVGVDHPMVKKVMVSSNFCCPKEGCCTVDGPNPISHQVGMVESLEIFGGINHRSKRVMNGFRNHSKNPRFLGI